jgi:hypothetical protein
MATETKKILIRRGLSTNTPTLDEGEIGLQTDTQRLVAGTSSGNVLVAKKTEVDGKQDTLVSGTNIKTINGTSLLGSGDIPIEGGGGAETDPVFTASPAAGITSQNITNWSEAYGWGDHSTEGYLTDYTVTSGDVTTALGYTPYNAANPAGYLTDYTVTKVDVDDALGVDSADDTYFYRGDGSWAMVPIGGGTTVETSSKGAIFVGSQAISSSGGSYNFSTPITALANTKLEVTYNVYGGTTTGSVVLDNLGAGTLSGASIGVQSTTSGIEITNNIGLTVTILRITMFFNTEAS